MADSPHRRPALPRLHNLHAMRENVRNDWAQGYVEVELHGISAQRLFCLGWAGALGLWQRTIGSLPLRRRSRVLRQVPSA